jgi:hypothetical protein
MLCQDAQRVLQFALSETQKGIEYVDVPMNPLILVQIDDGLDEITCVFLYLIDS